jgi:hypothetical protein
MSDTLNPGESLRVNESRTSANGRYILSFQGDCNLVLYKGYRFQNWRALWASGTYGKPAGECIMQNDGNLVIYDPNWKPLWSSNTWQYPGSRLVVQDDGNVVIYKPDWTPVWATNTWQLPLPPTEPVAQGDDMLPGEVLNPNQSISSANGRYTLVYQLDANLVLYKNYDFQNPRSLWLSATYGKPIEVCIIQNDGNLVIYDPDGRPLWASNTAGNPGSRLVVQDDGNVVIYKPDWTPVWATNTWQPLMGLVVPAFWNLEKYDPNFQKPWDDLKHSLLAVEVTVIEQSWPVTAQGNPSFKNDAIKRLEEIRGKTTILGYVTPRNPDYSLRDIVQILADAELWYQQFGAENIDGIYFDILLLYEHPDDYQQALDVVSQFKQRHPESKVMILAGATVHEGSVGPEIDWTILWEDTFNSYKDNSKFHAWVDPNTPAQPPIPTWWNDPKYRLKIVHVVHNCNNEQDMRFALSLAIQRNAANVFVMDKRGGPHNNRYDHLPPYWQAEANAV